MRVSFSRSDYHPWKTEMDCHSFILLSMLLLINYMEPTYSQAPKGVRNVFTKDFHDLVKYLATTDAGARLLAKIIKLDAQQRDNVKWPELDYSPNCSRTLLQIMDTKTMCPRAAKLIEPHLRSYERYHTVYRNKWLLAAVVVKRNCSELRGELAETCEQFMQEKIKARQSIKYETMFRGLHNCYLESKESHSYHFTKR